ncbi:sugar transferase [Paraconexibacter antarcticus]|uniref:Sugar transferase n=1 Tax=Paraconexibacter antarcticus TaxID=2949664 RepID=A0ABY5DN48_9ACTN|nr:sugar transferase [Paraconexibacter antarcticus]UTI62623.1 sugar transferase [Paraconexibacter antarcticus]
MADIGLGHATSRGAEAHVDPIADPGPFAQTPTLLVPAAPSPRDGIMRRALRGSDVAGLAVAIGGTVLATAAGGNAEALALFSVLALLLLQVCGLYARDGVVIRASTLDEIPKLLQALAFAAALTIVISGFGITGDTAPVTWAWALACVLLPGFRKVTRAIVRCNTAAERVLVLGSGHIAGLVATKIQKHDEFGLQVVGCLDAGDEGRPMIGGGPRLLGTLSDVEEVVEEYDVDRVVIAFSSVPHDEMLDAIRRCKRLRLKIDVVPRLFEVIGNRVDMHDIEGLTLLGLRGPVRSRGARAAKRLTDLAGATTLLVVLSPVMGLIALAVRLTTGGPALFRQERIGRGQQPFQMYKFRTMVEDAELLKATLRHLNEVGEGPMFKIAMDPRVTPIGRFLRRTSLDELPQFFNVLRGEMSIVGPRPLIREESDAVLGWHRARLDLTPGLTGPWQVMGRQNVPFDEMVKLDYLYVAEWSLWNDLKLALRTVVVILRRTGA